jgi:oxaloacetate decarboxylase beta subunit
MFIVILLIPSSATLIGMFMFGNIIRESGVVPRLSDAAQNEFTNLLTIFLGLGVGTLLVGEEFLTIKTLEVFALGMLAIASCQVFGILIAKLMNLFVKEKINPLIGGAGISAVPMAARVAQDLASAEDPSNYILMHAMGPNAAGVIGSAAVAGVFIGLLT